MPLRLKPVRRTRIGAAIAVAAAALATGLTADRAAAMYPAQSTEGGVVNLLGGYWTGWTAGSIDDFWRRTLPTWGAGYSKPGLRYYGNGFGGYYTTAYCGSTSRVANENGMYCPGDQTIYLDYYGQQGLLNRLGDHGSGGFLAHEWAHRAQHHLGTMRNDFRGEYNADCMAGLYTRYGYATGRLNGNDYWEFYYWLYGQSASYSHGTGPNRAAWYQWGYTQYSKAACDQAFTLTASGASARRGGKIGIARSVTPPRIRPVDLTPRRTRALPAGSKQRIIVPEDLEVTRRTPLS
jgi:Putative neutral zinc metallopeptidase